MVVAGSMVFAGRGYRRRWGRRAVAGAVTLTSCRARTLPLAAVAVRAWLPAAAPGVQRTEARPLESATTRLRDSVPAVAARLTVAPGTGLPNRSVARTLIERAEVRP